MQAQFWGSLSVTDITLGGIPDVFVKNRICFIFEKQK